MRSLGQWAMRSGRASSPSVQGTKSRASGFVRSRAVGWTCGCPCCYPAASEIYGRDARVAVRCAERRTASRLRASSGAAKSRRPRSQDIEIE